MIRSVVVVAAVTAFLVSSIWAEPVFVSEWTSVGVTIVRQTGEAVRIPFTAGTVESHLYKSRLSTSSASWDRDGLAFVVGDRRFNPDRPTGLRGLRPPNILWPADQGTTVQLVTSPTLDRVHLYPSPHGRANFPLQPPG